MKEEIKITKRIHKGWREWDSAIKRNAIIHQYFGKYQYLYQYENCIISLVKILDMSKETYYYEICQIQGTKIFEYIETFKTKKQADKRIRELFKNALFEVL